MQSVSPSFFLSPLLPTEASKATTTHTHTQALEVRPSESGGGGGGGGGVGTEEEGAPQRMHAAPRIVRQSHAVTTAAALQSVRRRCRLISACCGFARPLAGCMYVCVRTDNS